MNDTSTHTHTKEIYAGTYKHTHARTNVPCGRGGAAHGQCSIGRELFHWESAHVLFVCVCVCVCIGVCVCVSVLVPRFLTRRGTTGHRCTYTHGKHTLPLFTHALKPISVCVSLRLVHLCVSRCGPVCVCVCVCVCGSVCVRGGKTYVMNAFIMLLIPITIKPMKSLPCCKGVCILHYVYTRQHVSCVSLSLCPSPSHPLYTLHGPFRFPSLFLSLSLSFSLPCPGPGLLNQSRNPLPHSPLRPPVQCPSIPPPGRMSPSAQTTEVCLCTRVPVCPCTRVPVCLCVCLCPCVVTSNVETEFGKVRLEAVSHSAVSVCQRYRAILLLHAAGTAMADASAAEMRGRYAVAYVYVYACLCQCQCVVMCV